jgi:GMP synthase (glutamine-hydrolysing)
MIGEAGSSADSVGAGDRKQDRILVLDFGSQYSRLIARRVREVGVYSEIVRHDAPWAEIQRLQPRGIILSGGPASVYAQDAPRAAAEVFSSGVPLLGICYGMQLMTQELGGLVAGEVGREFGPAQLHVLDSGGVLAGVPDGSRVWMSHGDRVEQLAPGFRPLAESRGSPYAAVGNDAGAVGLQFHPEVVHTEAGTQIIENFVLRICGCAPRWTPGAFIDESVAAIRGQVGQGRVLCALSGGVDSAVAAALIARAIGDRLVCVFVDNGMLRKNEAADLIDVFDRYVPAKLVHVDASSQFLTRLKGVNDPEAKRRIIGDVFIRVFEQEAQKLGDIRFLAQGTLYPDVIESTAHDTAGAAAKIKTHHNVGGLPEDLSFTLVEPLRYLFKDEVRRVGIALGLPDRMVWRHPFPGPGLAVRIIGEVTEERLALLRDADHIVISEIQDAGLYRDLWQVFAVLTPIRTVGVMGDYRTYGNVVAVRAVTSEDAMTADWARLPYDVLARISNRIVNEVQGVTRVVYDVSSKPPSTIEWE